MITSMKVRLEPNNKQNTKLFQSAGTARWAYNWSLSKQEENYKNGGKFLSDGILRKELTELKKTEKLQWLNIWRHRTLEDYVKVFVKSGLTIVDLNEPRPNEDQADISTAIAWLQKIPLFLFWELTKSHQS